MKSLPDKVFDLIVTDPPYGMNYLSNHYKSKNPFGEIIGDDKYPVELIPEFQRLARKAVFAFCRWDNLSEVPPPKSFIVWVKNNWTAGDLKHAYGRMWEGILFYPLDEHKFNTRPPDVFDSRRIPQKDLVHPTQKPVALIKWLIEANANQNEVVFDPFMGVGTTGVAALELGLSFVGCEIDTEYFEIAEKRITQASLQQGLFNSTNNHIRQNAVTQPTFEDFATKTES
jgi:site-specific DNA-methyltransferase (adenine-specific)